MLIEHTARPEAWSLAHDLLVQRPEHADLVNRCARFARTVLFAAFECQDELAPKLQSAHASRTCRLCSIRIIVHQRIVERVRPTWRDGPEHAFASNSVSGRSSWI